MEFCTQYNLSQAYNLAIPGRIDPMIFGTSQFLTRKLGFWKVTRKLDVSNSSNSTNVKSDKYHPQYQLLSHR